MVLGDLITDEESARVFVRSMPTTEVAIEIKTAWHRNGQRNWTVNDIDDIDAMALAVPYCDVVVTEKACRHILTVAGLPERMETAVLDKLSELPRVLTERKPKQRFV
jgi:ABC-type transporter Mla MlaB component